MLARRLLLVLTFLIVAAYPSSSQNQQGVLSWRPTPTNPNDPVTMPAISLVEPADRARALELLDRARQNYFLQIPRGPSFTLSASFTSNGQLANEGTGRIEEVWAAPNLWKFSAQLGDFSMTRLQARGPIYGVASSDGIPARIQMARTLVTDPIPAIGGMPMLRSADVNWHGMKLTCVLLSGDVPSGIPRHWVEMEWCIDPASALLQTYSIAPGIYAVYDYSRHVDFSGHVIAGEINVFKNAASVMQIHVENIAAAGELADADFQPTPEMITNKPISDFGRAMRSGVIVDGPRDPGIPIQPVIVHATFSSDGKVLEIEPITEAGPDFVARALETVNGLHVGKAPPGAQREFYIQVQFMLRNSAQ